MLPLMLKRCLVACVLVFTIAPIFAAVEFPGPPPGKAKASAVDGSFTLENQVIAASWRQVGAQLRPHQIANRLTGKNFPQADTELFRLALTAPTNPPPGVSVAVRLEPSRVVALASLDGTAWTELAEFSRAEFPGEPRLVRCGKMNLQARPENYAADLGASGSCFISDLAPVLPEISPSRWTISARANEAKTKTAPFPSGCSLISCRIDKGTDQGMSWSPALAVIWEEGKKFLLIGVREAKPIFNVTTVAGETILEGKLDAFPATDLAASEFRLAGPPIIFPLKPDSHGVRRAEQIGGQAITASLISATGIRANWHAELRDGSSYIRQTVEFSSPQKKIPLYAVELAEAQIPDAKTIGTVPGCPVAGDGMILGLEMPGTVNATSATGVRMGFACQLELSPTQNYSFGSMVGVAPADQLRRAFLFYVERERARPSAPFLHYNCWYDLGFSVDAASLVDVVNQFHQELVVQRGLPVESYLIDDGWDTPGNGLWAENLEKFPGGFAALNQRIAAMNAHLAIWISPLGGYGGREERTATAEKMKLIPAGAQLDFAHPAYKQWFQERCLRLMRADGVNAFKWDKAGDGVSPHFMALLEVAHRLRQENPAVFINVTVGTWPSPFWLNHVDSTWRNGSADVGWSGKGDDREKWLTFRDGNCRRFFVEKSPLYPLNSVMHHGLVNGRCFQGERVGKAGAQLKNEARSYFANGASLQEMYLTPSLMTPAAWDAVAEAAKWAHSRATVLADAHWVGGDPLKLQTYGYAAWNPKQGTLMLRNPDDQPQTITLDAATVFELPAGAAKKYLLQSPFPDQILQRLKLEAGRRVNVLLAPFEVLVFDATPE